jgi:hypothetical protein
MRILAERADRFTTGDVARVLQVTDEGVRYLVRDGQLACERTPAQYRLFRETEVLDLAAKRNRARLRSVTALRRKRIGVRGGPRQLALFAPRLRLVGGKTAKAALENSQVDHARSLKENGGSDKRSNVNLRGRHGSR